MSETTETIFSKIIRREIPADIVYEDNLALAFKDINPQAPVHIILIPKQPIAQLADAESKDHALMGHLLLTAKRVAQQAGLHIKWAFDKLSHAITTYRLNFKTAMCEESNIFSFLTNDPDFLRVDVSHSSPPCQTFSPVHTVQVQDLDTHSTCCHTTSTRIRHWDQACN